jgi:hypothetical protein
MSTETVKQEIITLSKEKWLWMADRNVAALDNLFHENSVFVHMGGNMTKEHELGVISSGGIHYKHAEIEEVSVPLVSDTTVILYNKIRLDAVVGGHEVTNPFMVTEVYLQESGSWKLASLVFSKLLSPEDRPQH